MSRPARRADSYRGGARPTERPAGQITKSRSRTDCNPSGGGDRARQGQSGDRKTASHIEISQCGSDRNTSGLKRRRGRDLSQSGAAEDNRTHRAHAAERPLAGVQRADRATPRSDGESKRRAGSCVEQASCSLRGGLLGLRTTSSQVQLPRRITSSGRHNGWRHTMGTVLERSQGSDIWPPHGAMQGRALGARVDNLPRSADLRQRPAEICTLPALRCR